MLKMPASLRRAFQTLNRALDTFVQRWALQLTLLVHIAAPLVAFLTPASPYKNATIPSLVLAGFAAPATWAAAAARTRKLRHNGWRENTKALYVLWVPLMAFLAYWIGGTVSEWGYDSRLTPTYFYTSVVYAPLSFLLQWKLAGAASQPQQSAIQQVKQQTSRIHHILQHPILRAMVARVQRFLQHPITRATVARVQRIMQHPVARATSVALTLIVLVSVIRYGIIQYFPVLVHQKKGLTPGAETLTLTCLNSLVIMMITSACWLRTALPKRREYIKKARTGQAKVTARVALIFGTAGATLSGTVIAGIIYGVSFETSQWLSALHVAPAFAVYGKESVSNTLWLLVPLFNAREQVSVETIRESITQLLNRFLDRLDPQYIMQAATRHLSHEWEESNGQIQDLITQLQQEKDQHTRAKQLVRTELPEYRKLLGAHLARIKRSDPLSLDVEQVQSEASQLQESLARLTRARFNAEESKSKINELQAAVEEAEQRRQHWYAPLKALRRTMRLDEPHAA